MNYANLKEFSRKLQINTNFDVPSLHQVNDKVTKNTKQFKEIWIQNKIAVAKTF
jgi:hypothetical protein